MGGGSGADERLCLVQCVSIDDGDADEDQLEEEEGVVSRPTAGYRYWLTTFSLSYDTNGDLTSGETCRVQWYRVPREITQASSASEPVAFWL
nr:unnamed protein product [Digitaria exilis]